MVPAKSVTPCNTSSAEPTDQTTIVALIREARKGSRAAREQLLVRGLAGLRQWARRRVPARARDHMDTCDLAQEVALLTIARLSHFTPENAASMPAYLRRVATNRMHDEHRRAMRRPQRVDLTDAVLSKEPTPLTLAIQADERVRYQQALWKLCAKDRRLVVARTVGEWSLSTIAHRFRFRSVGAARMAVTRAEHRLRRLLASGDLDRTAA